MNGATERVHLSQISFHSDRKDEETKRKVQFGSHDAKHRSDFGVPKSRQHMHAPIDRCGHLFVPSGQIRNFFTA